MKIKYFILSVALFASGLWVMAPIALAQGTPPVVGWSADEPAPNTIVNKVITNGTFVFRFKMENLGNCKVTVRHVGLQSVANLVPASFKFFTSSQNANDYLANPLGSATTNGGAIRFALPLPYEIDGGAYRYFTMTVNGGSQFQPGDIFQYRLSSAIVTAKETDCGFDFNDDGFLNAQVTILPTFTGPDVGGQFVKN